MPKPHNTPVKPEEILIPGLCGFEYDTQAILENESAVESLELTLGDKQPNSDIIISEGSQRRTTTIYKKNDSYYVYFRVRELNSNWGDNLVSFSLWLLSLPANETVYIHQTGDIYNLTGLIAILDTLGTECKAKKVFVVDHPIENALFSLVCDEVIITEFGAFTFSNAMCIDPTKWDKILTPYLMSVYAKAVELKYLTQADVDAVFKDNAIIYKTAKDLRAQGVKIS